MGKGRKKPGKKSQHTMSKMEIASLCACHGQTQTLLPLVIIVNVIFPHAIDEPMDGRKSLKNARVLMLTCKSANYHAHTNTDFWTPFLNAVMQARFRNFSFPKLHAEAYVMWPQGVLERCGVVGLVKSKLFFCSYSVAATGVEYGIVGKCKCLLRLKLPAHCCPGFSCWHRVGYFVERALYSSTWTDCVNINTFISSCAR